MLLFKHRYRFINLKVILLASILYASLALSSNANLFESDELLYLTLEAPLKSLLEQRGEIERYKPVELPYLNSILLHEEEGGESVALGVRIKGRGNTRRMREVCDFPPIWINFKKKKVKGTVFEGQNKLKLVTHCGEEGNSSEQIVLKEYLAYRIYNLITDHSFRVRLVKVTYVDTDDHRKPITRYGFFIEDEDRMAERNETVALKIKDVTREMYDPALLNNYELYMFMIGNLDYSVTMAEPNSSCCHNARLILQPGNENLVIPVPYDFDHAGLVSAPYARPPKSLNMRSVKQRLYRGYCHNDGVVESSIELFNERKKAIYDVWENTEGLSFQSRKESQHYLNSFYDIVNDPKKLRRQIHENCQGEKPGPLASAQ